MGDSARTADRRACSRIRTEISLNPLGVISKASMSNKAFSKPSISQTKWLGTCCDAKSFCALEPLNLGPELQTFELSHPLMASPNKSRLNVGQHDHLEQGATQPLGFLKTVFCVPFPINDPSNEH
jgi:hypothetical protein